MPKYVQTEKGTKRKLAIGSVHDKLTVLEYLGKLRQEKSNAVWMPHYECLCSCGIRVVRSQQYILHNGRGKQCDVCAAKLKGSKKGRPPVTTGRSKAESMRVDSSLISKKW